MFITHKVLREYTYILYIQKYNTNLRLNVYRYNFFYRFIFRKFSYKYASCNCTEYICICSKTELVYSHMHTLVGNPLAAL